MTNGAPEATAAVATACRAPVLGTATAGTVTTAWRRNLCSTARRGSGCRLALLICCASLSLSFRSCTCICMGIDIRIFIVIMMIIFEAGRRQPHCAFG